MINLSRNTAPKALACEKVGRDATDLAIKFGWADIAIEWHALANRTARDSERDDLTARVPALRSLAGRSSRCQVTS